MATAVAYDPIRPMTFSDSCNIYHSVKGRRKIDCKPELVIASLQKFYATRTDLDEIIPYLKGEGELSLRLIDWFVTNYCRKNFVGYLLNGHEFLVYVSYKSQLKAYSKQYFDPNCRRERIQFQLPGTEPFLTTVGKLNFFRWAIEAQILDYIKEHYNEIQKERLLSSRESSTTTSKRSSTESSMSSYSSMDTVSTRSTTRRKRSKQLPSANAQLQKHEMEIRVSFD
jgi:hypothetical protein